MLSCRASGLALKKASGHAASPRESPAAGAGPVRRRVSGYIVERRLSIDGPASGSLARCRGPARRPPCRAPAPLFPASRRKCFPVAARRPRRAPGPRPRPRSRPRRLRSRTIAFGGKADVQAPTSTFWPISTAPISIVTIFSEQKNNFRPLRREQNGFRTGNYDRTTAVPGETRAGIAR